MATLSGFPYAEVQFDRDGNVSPPGQEAGVQAAIEAEDATDLVVIAHGWNNDMAEARDLYAAIFAQVAAQKPGNPAAADKRVAVLGLFWPSKKFTDAELIPGGGAASLGGAVSNETLEDLIEAFRPLAAPGGDAALDQARLLIGDLETTKVARDAFVALIAKCLDPLDPSDQAETADPAIGLQQGDALLADLSEPLAEAPRRSGLGGAAGVGFGIGAPGPAPGHGGALGAGGPIGSVTVGAERLLNFATYYQMKERAGRVGAMGATSVLRGIGSRFPQLRIHLVGHSFGARLVTAAAKSSGVRPASMVLLQAAFSHNAFAPRFTQGNQSYTGFFRSVVADARVAGPIAITHTVNDAAVGKAYAIASRIMRQAASDVGDPTDLYGGLGRNGAVRMQPSELGPETGMRAPGTAYAFARGKVHNLRADTFIRGHSDIRNPAVAHLLLAAMG